MRLPRLLLAVSVMCFVPAVAHADPGNMPPAAAAAIDASVVAALEGCRANVKAHPGSAYEAQVFAQQVDNAFVSGVVARGKADGGALINEANGYLDAAMKATSDQKVTVRLLSVKAVMLEHAGRIDDAKAVAKQAEDAYVASQGAKTAPATPQAPSEPAATNVLVMVTSKCAKAVAFGNGATASAATPSNLAAEGQMSSSFPIGDTVWLFDKNGKPISHARVGAHTKTIDVGKRCKSLVAR